MEINSIKDFYDFLHNHTETDKNQIYRGIRNSTWKLVPSVGRIQNKNGSNLSVNDEVLLLKVFKNRAYPFVKDYLDNEIELLTIGQHHGLPTRALDWTKNPLVGFYFAVEEGFTKDDEDETEYSALLLYEPPTKSKLDSNIEPFKLEKVERYIPKHWDSRIVAQDGLFTIHNEPYKPWAPKELKIVKIHKSIRNPIKKTLNRLGVHPGSIYPDIDGIAKYVKWLRSNEH